MLAPSPETVGRVKVEFPYLARQHRPEKIVVLRPDESEAVARTEVAAQVEQIFGADGCPAESAVSEIPRRRQGCVIAPLPPASSS